MKAPGNVIENFKRPLRNPYDYLSFRAKALRLRWEDWKNKGKSVSPFPVPPPLLRYRVQGEFDLETYLRIGQTAAQNIKDLLSSVGKDLYSFDKILDFGCGSGRVLRFFPDRPNSCHLYGTDIDKQAISWCKKHLHMASWSTNDPLPPTAYGDRTFDFIYAGSVFTHLDEEMQFAWLSELKRISKPDGVLILTVHGDGTRSMISEEWNATFSKQGFSYTVYQSGMFKFDGLPDFYQDTHHSRKYIEEKWSKFFKIIGYVECGMNEHQDAVILINQ